MHKQAFYLNACIFIHMVRIYYYSPYMEDKLRQHEEQHVIMEIFMLTGCKMRHKYVDMRVKQKCMVLRHPHIKQKGK